MIDKMNNSASYETEILLKVGLNTIYLKKNWKESLNSDGQQFHQISTKRTITSPHERHRTY